jgi:hypothetical protein
MQAHDASGKMTVFWMLCRVVGSLKLTGALTASITRALRLHGARSLKAAISKLAAVKTSNLI